MSNKYPKPTDDFDKAKNDLKTWGYLDLAMISFDRN